MDIAATRLELEYLSFAILYRHHTSPSGILHRHHTSPVWHTPSAYLFHCLGALHWSGIAFSSTFLVWHIHRIGSSSYWQIPPRLARIPGVRVSDDLSIHL